MFNYIIVSVYRYFWLDMIESWAKLSSWCLTKLNFHLRFEWGNFDFETSSKLFDIFACKDRIHGGIWVETLKGSKKIIKVTFTLFQVYCSETSFSSYQVSKARDYSRTRFPKSGGHEGRAASTWNSIPHCTLVSSDSCSSHLQNTFLFP